MVFSTSPLKMLKSAVFAPMASAIVPITVAERARERATERHAYRRSCNSLSSMLFSLSENAYCPRLLAVLKRCGHLRESRTVQGARHYGLEETHPPGGGRCGRGISCRAARAGAAGTEQGAWEVF